MPASRSDALVVFGVTGDLAHKMIFPALYALAKRGTLKVPVIGVEPVLKNHHRTRPYRHGSWGPKEADALIAASGSWHNPKPEKAPK